MAITDISISEELMTNAPSIKYRGEEGPKSPQEEKMMMADAILEEEYNKYVFDLLEIRPEATPMTLEEFRQMVIAEGQMSKGPILPSPEDPVNPFGPKPIGPPLPNRQMAAYGGIMGLDGRRQYGIGSSFKKLVRKVIPNEVAKVAEVAAPFVAPFNPLAAGLMSGIGGFDRTGRIGSSLKSGLMNYGLGQGARYLGGAGFQTGINPMTGSGVPGAGFFSSPMGTETGIGKFLDSRKPAFTPSGNKNVRLDQQPSIFGGSQTGDASIAEAIASESSSSPIIKAQKEAFKIADLPGLVKKNLQAAGLGNNLMTGLLVGGLGASALMGNMTEEEVLDVNRGEGLDIEGIRTEVIEAMKDPSGEALKAIRAKYPFLGTRDSKNIDAMGKAMGGRIGFENAGPVVDEQTTQMILDMKKRGMDVDTISTFTQQNADTVNAILSAQNKKAEGGIMDLGGMEKDYRNTGGFVDIGEYEKKDDVPARLSVNEFVMTADAVRGMGDGDIDLGAKRMENLMGSMENKKGAQQMFDVSERLSEVV